MTKTNKQAQSLNQRKTNPQPAKARRPNPTNLDDTTDISAKTQTVAPNLGEVDLPALLVNAIAAHAGSRLAKEIIEPESQQAAVFGSIGSRFGEALESGNILSSTRIQADFKFLEEFDLVGGDVVLMRAWHNSEATTLEQFKEDIEVAEAFQAYLANPTGVIALMMDQPDSDAAQAWSAILERAAELELHLPHEKDLDGAWGEVLGAHGNIGPECIPETEDDSLILTDPVTGEETVLHHGIDQGSEIFREE